MKLVIDIGNSRTKIGVFKKDDLLALHSVDILTKEFVQKLFIDFSQIDSAILSSVKTTDISLVGYLRETTTLIELDDKTPLPFINKYKTPETLGRDRIAAVAGAMALLPDSNVLIIDAGTCVTYDVLTASKEYLGGGISPGIKMRFDAMHTFTGKLPLIKPIAEKHTELTGNTTQSSMISGVQNGILHEVDGMIDQYKKQFPRLKVILTGGDYKYFDKYLKNNIFAAPNLVLIGLKKILNFDEIS